MLRECSLDEISNGKRFQGEDLVRVGCNDCRGCSDCCYSMGSSILLDPRDIYELTIGQNKTFEQLLENAIELNVVDGIILPNLKMQKEKECCSYLNAEGRCSIHSIRPGICRLFPLGRVYEDDGFTYFLQKNECKCTNKTKVRVRKWIDIPDFKQYEKYILDWHDYVKTRIKIMDQAEDEVKKQTCLKLLNTFFLLPYQKGDFYEQFYARLENDNS